jgi:putative transposase
VVVFRCTRKLLDRGMVVNHKRVARMMREDNLLAVRPRTFRVTTDSAHTLEVFLNLARRRTLTGILDAFSRVVVGWTLDRSLASRLAIAALEQAIAQRQPPLGLVHHSDRGIQYASAEYVALVQAHHMTPSMSRPANPCDYASCESFIKTLKREEIYANEYRTLEHLLFRARG